MRTRLAAVALAVAILGALPAPEALAHEGNPKFESQIEGIDPGVPGVEAEVLNFDDSIRLRNRGSRRVVVEGYEGEPYVRIDADGTVEVNRRSPAHFLNRDRYARSAVPASADAGAPPVWTAVDETGQYTWHDHRSHYMGSGTPPQVDDEGRRTKVFDYRVPLDVGGRQAAIVGTLYWQGTDDGFPLAPFVALGVAVLLGAAALVIRNRRDRGPPGHPPEAW